MSTLDLWDRCLSRLEAELPDRDLNTYLRPLRVVATDGGVTLLAPNRTVLDKVRSDYQTLIARTMSAIAEYDIVVNVAAVKMP